eukprot:6175223-Pleurochrysis_carterae.AAC.2
MDHPHTSESRNASYHGNTKYDRYRNWTAVRMKSRMNCKPKQQQDNMACCSLVEARPSVDLHGVKRKNRGNVA